MTHTVEDTLEILAGLTPRKVNIRLDHNERTLVSSLGRQVQKQIALTDRQLDLALKKVSKYRAGLEANGVDVFDILSTKPLRMPLREIDRVYSITLEPGNDSKSQILLLKFVFSKKIASAFDTIRNQVDGDFKEVRSSIELQATEKNLLLVVDTFAPLEFEISEEILKIYEKIQEILKNSENLVPSIDLENDQVVVKNVSKNGLAAVTEEIQKSANASIATVVSRLKNYGIFHKSEKIIEKISSLDVDENVKRVVLTKSTRFRVPQEKYSIDDIVKIINTVDQWPVLVLLEDQKDIFEHTVTAYEAFKQFVPNDQMTVFFRLDNGQPNHDKFNQFVKDNALNNYIDSKTKVVFITKNKIPKPLVKADWHPRTAIVIANYDYGKTSAYLNDFSTVYYYNDSITVRHNKIKGSSSIVEL